MALAGLLVAAYELLVLVRAFQSTGSSFLTLPISLGLTTVALASILATRRYLQSGTANACSASVFFTVSYALIAFCAVLSSGTAGVGSASGSSAMWSPMCALYLAVGHGTLRLMGDNTRAEVARAEQLEKLEQLFNTCRD